jgi:UDP-glucose 4-epimerase
MREQLKADDTDAEKYEIASDEDPSVIIIAERVKELAREELGREVDIQLVDNPRSGETLVEDFTVDTTKARERLGWEPEHTVEESIRGLLRARAEDLPPQE